MASAQAMEEELQQSVMLSEDDAGYETAETAGNGSTINAAPHELDDVSGEAIEAGTKGDARDVTMDDEADLSDRDASGEDVDEDFGGGNYKPASNNQITVGGDEDEDEDGEDDEDGDEEAGSAAEEIGAVKIKPESSDGIEDGGSDASDLPSAENPGSDDGSDDEEDEEEEEEDEGETAWDDANGADEEEEDQEAWVENPCLFCKQDEEHDPGEDFEAFLACSACGANAHQQCARDAAAMSDENSSKRWRCPDCYAWDSNRERELGSDEAAASDAGDARPKSQTSDIPRDLLPTPRGRTDPDAHSVFNDLVLGEDPMDGSRVLRKRKSSAEADEAVFSMRKRRRHSSEDPLSLHEGAANVARNGESARQQSARKLRLKSTRQPPVSIEKQSRTSMVLKMQVKPGNLREVLARKKRDIKRRATGGAVARVARTPAARNNSTAEATPIPIYALPTPFTSDAYSQPFYSFFDKDTEGVIGKPYDGIFSEAEADTSKTLPLPEDRRKFELSKQKAEDEWRARVLAMQEDADMPTRRPKKMSENASQIECIEFGGWEIDTWYAAPYPAEYSRNRVLYICEFCLKYMNSDYVAWRHKLKCATKHPPGDEIYRHRTVSIFEVDGRKNPVYCQNLCLLAKLFLGSKTLYYDVEPFLFYVLCEYDDCGYHFVGYFSKEKRASSQNNVSCILTLPIHQRKGYGNLLIDFSYLLTKVEDKTGSPEKPLSDMGLVSYRNYWRLILCRYLLSVMEAGDDNTRGLSIKSISEGTGMTPDDVIAALEALRALVRDPQTKLYAFRIDGDYCRQYVAKWEAKGYVQLKPRALAWTPYVMGRSNAVNFELGHSINTIAPREDDEAKVEEGPNSVGAQNRSGLNGEKDTISQQDDKDDGEEADEVEVVAEAAGEEQEQESQPISSIEKVPPEDKENESPEDVPMDDLDPEDPSAWAVPYNDVPPNRFEIFPPANGGRRTDRPRRGGAMRPSAPRTGSSGSRPRRSAGGSIRRPKPSRPKPNTTRRKSGGTGRGPGRWPKGTKKSDYGNADSGPGLPPGWQGDQEDLDRAIARGELKLQRSTAEDDPARDSVQVYVSTAATNGGQVNGLSDYPSGLVVNGRNGVDVAEDDIDAEGEDA